ncbi:MAG: radical SAM protein [Chitinispirillaceae bacterium]|nr:radical SAM protein [Chitinispirillaceae bacterium]
MLKVCEIFKSIQGESTHAGKACSFVRLTGCNLHCSFCDTEYALTDGEETPLEKVVRAVQEHRTRLVEVTGGEPLLQAETPLLCKRFLELGYTVLVETNGSLDISLVPPPAIRIVDIKCPSSGHEGSFLKKNFSLLMPEDECKFVLSDRDDFYWALDVVRAENLHETAAVIFSPNMKLLPPGDLAEWILEENAPVRLGMQLHKVLWGDKRAV